MDMYADAILEHYRKPHNYGSLEKRNAEYREHNPLCGDIIEMQVLIENNKIKDVKFTGHGCAISQSASSMLTDEIKGKSLEEIKKMDKEHVLDMLGVDISPARMKCALIGIKALKLAVYKYLLRHGGANEKEFEVQDA